MACQYVFFNFSEVMINFIERFLRTFSFMSLSSMHFIKFQFLEKKTNTKVKRIHISVISLKILRKIDFLRH